MRRCLLAVASLAIGLVFAVSSIAAPLPGGAGSLVETYEDWVVSCAAPEGETVCVMRQSQNNQETGQHILTAELRTGTDGAVEGTLLMPFGLALAQGIALAIDETEGPTFPFLTCLPQGCVAPVNFDHSSLENLKTGDALKITVHAVNAEQRIAFTVSLNGFTAALNRMTELMQ
ncbi:invasion associated locus B family protein [Chelativorans sp. YIM 93263]|uniref:invasion associated locus B family protein n=1 Tax=Chelativorans sp. YIM 93263 TaxID=2906648 RepID=UPI0023792F09|nr:invasion associated locus B family protein [Chelativorans sp. YIM 93263]